MNFGSKRKQRYSSLPPSGGFGRYSGVVSAAPVLPVLSDWDGVAVGVELALGLADAAGSAGISGMTMRLRFFCQVNLFPDFEHL